MALAIGFPGFWMPAVRRLQGNARTHNDLAIRGQNLASERALSSGLSRGASSRKQSHQDKPGSA